METKKGNMPIGLLLFLNNYYDNTQVKSSKRPNGCISERNALYTVVLYAPFGCGMFHCSTSMQSKIDEIPVGRRYNMLLGQ